MSSSEKTGQVKIEHTPYYKIGWIIMSLAVIPLITVLLNECTKPNFDSFLPSMANSAQITAALAAIAGLFLVLDNLVLQRNSIEQQNIAIDQQKEVIRLQKDELRVQNEEAKTSNEYFKQQNEAIRSQQFQTTFFKLLENHTNLVTTLKFTEGIGYQGLNKFYDTVSYNLNTYKHFLKTGRVKDFSIAKWYPPLIVGRNLENFILIINSAKHIVHLIKRNLNDDEFYHETFSNSLTSAEKYFIGLFVYTSEKYNEIFKTDKFNYLHFFESNKAFFNCEIHGYFPEVRIGRTKTGFSTYKKSDLEKSNYDKENFSFDFEIINDQFRTVTNLKSIKFVWKPRDRGVTVVPVEKQIQIADEATINLKEIFGSTIIKDFLSNFDSIKERTNQVEYDVTLVFVSDYGNRDLGFQVSYRLTIRISGDSDVIVDFSLL